MSGDAVHFRELTDAIGSVRTEVVSEIRVMGDRMERRLDPLEGRMTEVEIKLAAHERAPMHDGTAHEFGRITDVLDRLGDQLTKLATKVAYGAGVGAVLFIIAQILMARIF